MWISYSTGISIPSNGSSFSPLLKSLAKSLNLKGVFTTPSGNTSIISLSGGRFSSSLFSVMQIESKIAPTSVCVAFTKSTNTSYFTTNSLSFRRRPFLCTSKCQFLKISSIFSRSYSRRTNFTFLNASSILSVLRNDVS